MKNRIDTFLERYREPVPGYLREMEKYARDNHIPVMGRGTADLLRYIIRTLRPKNILEIGTAIGYSALYMKECVRPDVTITTIEKIESRYEIAKDNFKKYDKDDQITILCEDAADAIVKLRDEGKKFDLIFLDAAKGQYVTFLQTLVDMLTPNGELVTDNIFHEGTVLNSRYAVTQRDRTIHERMREYLKLITEHEQIESVCLPIDDGIAVSKKVDNQ